MITSRSVCFAILLSAACGATGGHASTITLDIPYSTDGAESAGVSRANGALGTEFRTGAAVSDISISFQLDCFGSCAGELVLVADRPGPSIPFRAFQAREFFERTGTGRNRVTIEAFNGQDLEANTTYALVMAVTEGNLIWTQTDPSRSTSNGITDGQDFFATEVNDQAIYRSVFTFEPLEAANFNLRITGNVEDTVPTPAPVPLPASSWLLGGALLSGLWLRRRQSKA